MPASSAARLPANPVCELTEMSASPRGSQTWLSANTKHSFFSTCIGRIAELKPNSLTDQTNTHSLFGLKESQKLPYP